MKKILAVIMTAFISLAIHLPTAGAAVSAADGSKTRVAVIMDTPMVIGDDEKIREPLLTKIREWFPGNKYELADFNELQILVTEYREENDMVIYEENTKSYKPLKITDIEKIVETVKPDLVVNLRCTAGTGKTVATAFSVRTKINVTTNIRILDMKEKKYIQRYETTEAVGSGDIWGNSSAARSYRKGLIKGIEGFKPDHNLY